MNDFLKFTPLFAFLAIIALAARPPREQSAGRFKTTSLASPVYAQEKPEEEFLSIIDKLVIIHRRMRAASERLERFSERLESRLTKLEQKSADTSTARQLLDKAKAHQRQADQEVVNLDIAISRATNSSPPHSEAAAAIDQVKKTKTALLETLENIQKAVAETRRLSETD